MELWGAAIFGDPCRECAFDWTQSPEQALAWMEQAAGQCAEATAHAHGSERADGWSVSEYVSHVGDNLRQWAERLQGARADRPHLSVIAGAQMWMAILRDRMAVHVPVVEAR